LDSLYSTALGWSWECLDEWGTFLKLAVPGTITVAAEISNFEIGAFVTGSVNETQQAAYIIMFNIAVMCYMVWPYDSLRPYVTWCY